MKAAELHSSLLPKSARAKKPKLSSREKKQQQAQATPSVPSLHTVPEASSFGHLHQGRLDNHMPLAASAAAVARYPSTPTASRAKVAKNFAARRIRRTSPRNLDNNNSTTKSMTTAGAAAGRVLPAVVVEPSSTPGPGQPPRRAHTVVFLHGWPDSPTLWQSQMEVWGAYNQSSTL